MDAQDTVAIMDDRVVWKRAAVVLPFFAFAIPLLVSGPQLLTGTVVNSFLFIAALKLDRSKRWPVIILPSIAAVLNGLLFGTFTPFLALFLPFIWVGNAILVESFLALRQSFTVTGAAIAGSVLKAAFLFACAFALYRAGLVPAIFLTAMSVVQLGTALAGGAVASLILHFSRR